MTIVILIFVSWQAASSILFDDLFSFPDDITDHPVVVCGEGVWGLVGHSSVITHITYCPPPHLKLPVRCLAIQPSLSSCTANPRCGSNCRISPTSWIIIGISMIICMTYWIFSEVLIENEMKVLDGQDYDKFSSSAWLTSSYLAHAGPIF